jgi:hypothetical protein
VSARSRGWRRSARVSLPASRRRGPRRASCSAPRSRRHRTCSASSCPGSSARTSSRRSTSKAWLLRPARRVRAGAAEPSHVLLAMGPDRRRRARLAPRESRVGQHQPPTSTSSCTRSRASGARIARRSEEAAWPAHGS